MQLLRTIQQNPITLLYLAVLALIGWVAVDLAQPPKTGAKKPDAQEDMVPVLVAGGIHAPPMPEDIPSHPVRATALQKLRPGMTRHEVEGLLGIPAADRVEPVTASDGRLTYRTAYELAETSTPTTIRPIRPMPRVPGSTREVYSPHVALEFDASRPGHPLVDVLYLDPLF